MFTVIGLIIHLYTQSNKFPKAVLFGWIIDMVVVVAILVSLSKV